MVSTWVLVIFILYPDSFPYVFKRSSNSGNDSPGRSRYAMTSSAKRPTLCSTPHTVTPWIHLFSRMAWANGSIKYANRVGDKQHPCLVDLCRSNLLDRLPFILILAVGR